MKAVILSDIHKMSKRSAVLEFFKDRKFDCILVNGDLLGEYEIPQTVKEFGAVDRYLRTSDGAALIRECAPKVSDELLEFLGTIKSRNPEKSEMNELERLLEEYATERYDGILKFLSELTKSGNVFFNYGESESPYGLAIENEIAQLTGSDPQVIMKLRSTRVFPRFERKLYEMEEETHLFHYVSGENEEFKGYVIAGIPGVYGESQGGGPAQEQEGVTLRVLDEVENASRLILLYHSSAPPMGVFGKTKGSDLLLRFLKNRTAKTIVVNSHHHLLNSVFLKIGPVWYLVPTSVINDELGLMDTEGVRYFEVRIPSGRLTELSAAILHEWDRTVPDLLKRMY